VLPQLRLVEASLNISAYTDKVDQPALKGKAKRTHVQLQEICAMLSSLVASAG
jgi:hypothetical protein